MIRLAAVYAVGNPVQSFPPFANFAYSLCNFYGATVKNIKGVWFTVGTAKVMGKIERKQIHFKSESEPHFSGCWVWWSWV